MKNTFRNSSIFEEKKFSSINFRELVIHYITLVCNSCYRMGMVNYSNTISQFLFCLFGFITRRIELDKTIKIYIAFYYLNDAIGPF